VGRLLPLFHVMYTSVVHSHMHTHMNSFKCKLGPANYDWAALIVFDVLF